MSESLIMEAWRGAYDAARRFKLPLADCLDAAQDAALAVLQTLAQGKAIRHPKAFGQIVVRRKVHRTMRRRAIVSVNYYGRKELEKMGL